MLDSTSRPAAKISGRTKGHRDRPPQPQPRRGFTLIEMLVVISIVSVLIAISVTGLKGARERATTVRVLARLGQLQKGFTAYTVDYKDTFPALIPPNQRTRTITYGPRTREVRYFEQYCFWHLFLAESYFGVPWDSRAVQDGDGPGGEANAVWYSQTFLAAPEYWDEDLRTGSDQRRAVRAGEVQFPSSKILLVLSVLWHTYTVPAVPLPDTMTARVDGSASKQPVESFLRGVPAGHEAFLDGATGAFWPGMETRAGARGRDLQ